MLVNIIFHVIPSIFSGAVLSVYLVLRVVLSVYLVLRVYIDLVYPVLRVESVPLYIFIWI